MQYSPKNHVIYSNRSMCYGRLGKYAVRRCAQSCGFTLNSPLIPPCMSGPSPLLCNPQDALADAKTVVAMMPTWAKGFARLAAAHEALGHDAEAVAAYDKAKWLAGAHDNDPAGEAEYEAASVALRKRVAHAGYAEDAVNRGMGY